MSSRVHSRTGRVVLGAVLVVVGVVLVVVRVILVVQGRGTIGPGVRYVMQRQPVVLRGSR